MDLREENGSQPAGSKVYNWLMIAGGVIYLTLPLFIFFPSLFAGIAGIPVLEGERLVDLRSLLLLVTPIGLIYLYAVCTRSKTLMDLTLLWRLFWVAPWLIANWAVGTLEKGAMLFIASVDIALPVAMLALSSEARGFWPRLRSHFDRWNFSSAHKIMAFEGRLSFLGALAFSIHALLQPQPHYVMSFVTAVPACYSFFLMWAAKEERCHSAYFALFMRALVIASLAACIRLGFDHEILYPYLAFTILGLYAHAYGIAWENFVRSEKISLTVWIISVAVLVILVSIGWYTVSPAFEDAARQLAFNIHRQDLIIGGFSVLVAILLFEIQSVVPLHAKGIAWLLPFSAIWFTIETKMLANLGVGTPLHPSWPARGLAPMWGGSVTIDVTFWMATLFLTAITTTYTALVFLRFLPRQNSLKLSWHGIAIILVSSLWMIASSSGLPAPTESLAPGGSIPPFLPGNNPIGAVSIHVRDLILGMALITSGLLLKRVVLKKNALCFVIVILWWATLLPKAWFHAQGVFGKYL